jgi:hypothetical protein
MLERLFGRGDRDDDAGKVEVADALRTLAQVDPYWSPERIRRRVKDIFFALERSWIERDPEVAAEYLTARFAALHRVRIKSLIDSHHVHRLEAPIIEELVFMGYHEAGEENADPILGPLGGDPSEPQVAAAIKIRMTESLRDDRDDSVISASDGELFEQETWALLFEKDNWMLDQVTPTEGGSRAIKAPMVSDAYAKGGPELALREQYARGEIELDDVEKKMSAALERGPVY